MPTYDYWAKSADGKDVKGRKDAASVGALVSDLKREGLIVINVEEPGAGGKKEKAASRSGAAPAPAAPSGPSGPQDRLTAKKRRPVKVRDLAILCRQLSTMLKAGLSIIDAFETIANEADNLTMQETLFEMRDDIEGGSSLSESINKHPKIFSLMFRAMIEAGEASGSLTKIVAQLGEYLKKRDALQRKIKAATMYPKFVMGFFAVIVTGILLFLVPQFESTFASLSKPCKQCSDRHAAAVPDPNYPNDKARMKPPPGTGFTVNVPGEKVPTPARLNPMTHVVEARFDPGSPDFTPVTDAAVAATFGECKKCKGYGVTAPLPAMTQFLLDMSRVIKQNVLFVIAAVILLIILWKKYSSSDTGRQQLDRLILKVPVAGTIALKSSVARFCLTLSTLLNNGVSLDHSLDIVSRVAGNTVVEEATQQVRELIVQGQGLSESMARFPIFPPMVNKMVSVGEESGALAEMLTDISDYYEEEVNSVVEGISTVIEPLMIVMIGAVVCVVVLALYLPIFKLGDAVSGG